MDADHVRKESEQYEQTVREMAKDYQRTDRQREVERAFGGKNLRRILSDLHDKTGGNRSEMVRRINENLEGDESLSRQTLYNWLDDHGIS